MEKKDSLSCRVPAGKTDDASSRSYPDYVELGWCCSRLSPFSRVFQYTRTESGMHAPRLNFALCTCKLKPYLIIFLLLKDLKFEGWNKIIESKISRRIKIVRKMVNFLFFIKKKKKINAHSTNRNTITKSTENEFYFLAKITVSKIVSSIQSKFAGTTHINSR